MSIINDAIKKAREESEAKNRPEAGYAVKDKKRGKFIFKFSEIQWTTLLVISLVVIMSLFGSVIVYKHVSRIDTAAQDQDPDLDRNKASVSTTTAKSAKGPQAPKKFESSIKLNGIVYGPNDKWAIINNKIVKENDFLAQGRLTYIAKDFVKIRRETGEEIVLNLEK